jgi:FkbM family methyltransferase
MKEFQKIKRTILNLVKTKSKNQKIQSRRCKEWFKDDGDRTLRLNYPLNESSIIFDIGGYHGEFASDIYCKFGSTVYIFEPIELFYNKIREKFLYNKNVYVYNFGLGAKTSTEFITFLDNSSSLFAKNGEKISIQIKSISEFIKENKIDNIDLVKINIEGAEYELLESLIENKLVDKFVNLQIQFHDFVIENARERMEKIQKEISRTHVVTWQYDFVWENWHIKNKSK